MIKVTYMACDFQKTDSNEHRSFDEEIFRKYISSEEFQKKLKGKLLVGALSHQARDQFIEYKRSQMNPSVGNQSDYLLSNNLGANVLVDAYIKDHKLFLSIETLPFGQGLALEALYNLDMDMQVSMSTELDIVGDKYHIVNLFGLDCTVSPAFSTYMVSKEVV